MWLLQWQNHLIHWFPARAIPMQYPKLQTT
jgi:hypothetical protein